MKRFTALFLAAVLLLVALPASAAPMTSYAAVQDLLLAAAYKIQPADVALSGTVHSVVPSYTFKTTYYIFVAVDPDDVSMWSTEDDNFFVFVLDAGADPLPVNVGDAVTVEGQVISIYSSPVCPYIKPSKVNGADV